jgi:carbon starvation protein
MFGVANQLLAAIALGVGTTVIIKSGKLKYAWVTFIPLCFMFVTTLTAAWQLAFLFRAKAVAAKAASDVFVFNLDALLVICMGALAVIALADMVYKWYGWIAGMREMKTTEVVG